MFKKQNLLVFFTALILVYFTDYFLTNAFSVGYYVSSEWPPRVYSVEGFSVCDNIKGVSKVVLDGNNFCVTNVVKRVNEEIVHEYAYALNTSTKTIIFVFEAKFKDCEKMYGEQIEICWQAVKKFNPDEKIKKYLQKN